MESLESHVRECLGQKRREEAYALTQEPKYKSLIRDYTKIVVDSLVKAAGKDFREEELAEKEDIEQILFMGEQGRLLGAQCTFSKQDVVGHHPIIAHPLLVPPYDNHKAVAKYLKLKEELSFLDSIQDRIVESLTQVAEREGVENALTDKNEYAAIRRIFPTKDEYVAHRRYEMRVMEEFQDYLDIENKKEKMVFSGEGLMPISMSDAEEKQFETMIEEMLRAFEGMKGMREQVVNDELLKKAQNIYGA